MLQYIILKKIIPVIILSLIMSGIFFILVVEKTAIASESSFLKVEAMYQDNLDLNFSLAKSAKNDSNKKSVSARPGIGKAGPIISGVKIIDGKKTCRKKNDHPQRSSRNPFGHIDAECCLDPDEIPNSLCYYPQTKYSKMIKKYLREK